MAALDESPRVTGPAVLLRLTKTNTALRPCILLGILHGKMHIRGEQWIEPGSTVAASVAGIAISGEVDYCTRKDTWYRACIAIISDNHDSRSAPRLPVRQPGRATVLHDDANQSSAVMLLDLSVSGIRLEVPHFVEPGTMIFVQTASNLIVGEVRHCREGRRGSFEAGIEITDILSDTEPRQNSPGFLRSFRRKIGHAIIGKSTAIDRRLA